MRKNSEVYWTTSLPRDHEALRALDAYCQEWGGLSRAEATRRLLIEWHKLKQGQPIAAWTSSDARPSAALGGSGAAARATGAGSSFSFASPSARAASQVLDE
jgi:hypothetical protein